MILKFDFVKSDSKFGSWYQLPLLAYSVEPIKSAVEILKQCEEPQKIAASFKQNLKTDGYESRYDISSMGSLWKLVQLVQAMRLSIQTPIFRCKMLVGNAQTLELYPLNAGLASLNEKAYDSGTLSAIDKQLFPAQKENGDDLR